MSAAGPSQGKMWPLRGRGSRLPACLRRQGQAEGPWPLAIGLSSEYTTVTSVGVSA